MRGHDVTWRDGFKKPAVAKGGGKRSVTIIEKREKKMEDLWCCAAEYFYAVRTNMSQMTVLLIQRDLPSIPREDFQD